MINDRGEVDLALRALRDCGCIRVQLGRVPRRYQAAQKAGLISAKRADEGHAIIRLNLAGQALANKLKPWSQNRG